MDSRSGVRVLWTLNAARPVADDLIRQEVARLLSCGSDRVHVGRVCPACASSGHGRPVVRADAGGAYASIARSDTATVVAVTRDGPVGIDLELNGAAAFEGFAGVALDAKERAASDQERTRTWVRKEAVLKAAGLGLRADPSRLQLTGPADPPALLHWPGHERLAARTQLHDVNAIPGHLAAVALLAPDVPSVLVRRAEQVAPSPRARR